MEGTKRRTRAELRELVMRAGRDILREMNPTLGFEQLSYARVFERLERDDGIRVTHASVHERIWPSQSAFQFDVLKSSLEGLVVEVEATYASIVADTIDAADLDTLQGRKQLFTEVTRLAHNANWEAIMLVDHSRLRAYRMLHFSLSAVDPATLRAERRPLVELMQEIRGEGMERYLGTIIGLAKLIGARPRAELGPADTALARIAEATNLLAVGFLVDPTRDPDEIWRLPTGPDGAEQEWRPVSHAVWNYLRGALELSDDGLTDIERRL